MPLKTESHDSKKFNIPFKRIDLFEDISEIHSERNNVNNSKQKLKVNRAYKELNSDRHPKNKNMCSK